jgi:hypothetical protein
LIREPRGDDERLISSKSEKSPRVPQLITRNGKAGRLMARVMLVEGKATIGEIEAATGLSRSSIMHARSWLSSASGREWIENYKEGRVTVPPMPPAPVAQPLAANVLARGAQVTTGQPRERKPPVVILKDASEGLSVQGTAGKGRGTVQVTSLTLDYYDRANADYIYRMSKKVPPNEVPKEYPGGIAGFIQDCVVKCYAEIYGMKLAWVEVERPKAQPA